MVSLSMKTTYVNSGLTSPDTSLLLTGWNDGTTCFHRGGSLYEWLSSVDPFREHARFFPY
jgi:hypothetical protein